MPVLSVIALLGSLIGANILLNVDTGVLQIIIGILLLTLLPFIFLKRKIGVKHIKTSKFRIACGLLIYFLIMTFGGFFGQGTGPLTFYLLTFLLGFTMVEVLATGTISWLVLSTSSVIIFALNGIINYEIGIILLVGMSIGGYFGAHAAVKKDNTWIKYLFILFVIIFAVKLLFF